MTRFLHFSAIAPLILLTALLSLAPSSGAAASEHKNGKTTAADVKKEAGETYTAMKSYTVEQRDEAIAFAKNQLDEIDARIERIEWRLQNRWDVMSQSAREEARETLSALRQQRNEVAEWYGGIRHSSANAWEEVKQGFSESFDRLRKAFSKASREFGKDDKKKK